MRVQELFEKFNSLNVVVIGDVMLDSYIWGRVERISPEAPVPIVTIQKKEDRLGGAANVALNLHALGAKPFLCSVIGNDSYGSSFLQLLKDAKLPANGIIQSTKRPTTVKSRIIGNNHQMLRVDEEVEHELETQEQQALLAGLKNLLSKERIDVIVFEDYDKGVLDETIISKVITLAKEHNIPTAVDPKKKNFLNYKGVDLFKPNLKELKEGLKIDLASGDIDAVLKASRELQKLLSCNKVMVTLSEHGVLIVDNKDHYHEEAHLRKIADVSGAGDTVISVASLCLALNLPMKRIAAMANLAGGLVCERVGVVSIEKEQLIKEAEANKA